MEGAAAPPTRIVSFDIGLRNFALCVVSAEAGALRIQHWEVIDIVAEAGAPCKTIDAQVRGLVGALRQREELWQSLSPADSAVVVEQQPNNARYGAMSMNVLQHIVGAFFAIRAPEVAVVNLHAAKKFSPAVLQLAGADPAATDAGTREFWYWCADRDVHAALLARLRASPHISEHEEGRDGASGRGVVGRLTFRRARKSVARAEQCVGLQDPHGGLSEEPLAEPPAPMRNKRRRYKTHKTQSVAYTEAILATQPSLGAWAEFFASHAKRDDLGDALLQGLSQLLPLRDATASPSRSTPAA
jgi:hypothetical protein